MGQVGHGKDPGERSRFEVRTQLCFWTEQLNNSSRTAQVTMAGGQGEIKSYSQDSGLMGDENGSLHPTCGGFIDRNGSDLPENVEVCLNHHP